MEWPEAVHVSIKEAQRRAVAAAVLVGGRSRRSGRVVRSLAESRDTVLT